MLDRFSLLVFSSPVEVRLVQAILVGCRSLRGYCEYSAASEGGLHGQWLIGRSATFELLDVHVTKAQGE
jgi:hypothetical protein